MSEFKQAIVIRNDLKMGKGKIAAQASHASIGAYVKCLEKHKDWAEDWFDMQKKVVLKVDSVTEIVTLFESIKKELPCVLIKDAGRTQIEPGSITALGIGPAPEEKIDKYTHSLKLL